MARIPDFYRPGDDRVIFGQYLGERSEKGEMDD